MNPRVLILRAPGTNCDEETAFAFERAGGVTERVHVRRLLDRPQLLHEFQIVCIPGGFSYGDDVAAGRILANQIQHHLAACLSSFHDAGKLILGICNGFQVLLKSGILLAADSAGPLATLTWNDSGKFEDRWVQLHVDQHAAGHSPCIFLEGTEHMYLPVAHAEGRFVARDADALQRLEASGQIVLRYDSQIEGANGNVAYPDNPNGSQHNVAGICDVSGRILGLMPHPERYIEPTHHPRWTLEAPRSDGNGLLLFQNAVRYFL